MNKHCAQVYNTHERPEHVYFAAIVRSVSFHVEYIIRSIENLIKRLTKINKMSKEFKILICFASNTLVILDDSINVDN